MDFQTLLTVAKNNTLNKKEPVNCLKTKFKPQTKEQKDKQRALSDGVSRFLARKAEEEKRKKEEANRKRSQLMELRAKDPKAAKQMERMVRHAKSSNKSVMQDVDTTNTAITAAGPSQPDEDDYGFCSESSSALYDKLIQKLYKLDTPKQEPEKKPFIKKPVPKTEKPIRDKSPINKQKPVKKEPEPVATEKPKPKRPQPIDFVELLKIAEKKQYEPIVIEPKVKKSEPEQLLTKKQRDELAQMEKMRREREMKSKTTKPIPRIDKKPVTEKPKLTKESKVVKKSVESDTDRLKRERDEALRALQEKEAAFKMIEEKERLIRERDEALKKLKEIEEREARLKNGKPAVKGAMQEVKKNVVKVEASKQFPAKHVRRPEVGKSVREFPPKDVRRPEVGNSVREFPPRDVARPKVNGKSLPKKRNIIDSDEEYDSDLDDFIVDAPDPSLRGEDVSRIISDIFKYDKKKYAEEYDDDDDIMESNWAQISKEDYISTRIGIMEDLEDMKAEKEALARKKKKV